MPTTLAATLLSKLREAADPTRAPAMRAYMKSAMPYLGVPAEPLGRVCKSVFADLEWPDSIAWQDQVLTIWRTAQFREERYAAIALCEVKAAHHFQDTSALPLYEEMVVTGAWWDYVDNIAGKRLWTLLHSDRAAMRRAMLAWSKDADLWKRRSSIICQLRAKAETDLDLLYACITPSLGSEDFFLRKAIGWALRQYARTDPEEARRYVAEQDANLSSLSKREALKRIGTLG